MTRLTLYDDTCFIAYEHFDSVQMNLIHQTVCQDAETFVNMFDFIFSVIPVPEFFLDEQSKAYYALCISYGLYTTYFEPLISRS